MDMKVITAATSQVIKIPKEISKALKIKKGSKFLIVNKEDTIVLKKVSEPSLKTFEEIVDWGVEFVREKGIRPEDVIDGD